MIATTHIIAGSAIGSQVDAPWLAFVLGFASHHLLDAVPHLDYGDIGNKKGVPFTTWLYIGMDLTVGALLLAYFIHTPHHQPGLVWGALGGLLPDIIDNSPLWLRYTRRWPLLKQHWQFHEFVQRYELKPNLKWLNIILQATVIILGLAFIPY